MSNERIRIGLIGAGGNTKARHIPGFKAIDGVDIVAVANRSRASSEKVASAFNIPRIYESWQALLLAQDIDAVCIGTWPYMHCPITLAALEAGKHVLCEARMAMNATEARRMLTASRTRPELVSQIVPAPPTLEVDSTLQELLASGYVGELHAVELSVLTGFIDLNAPLHWRQDAALSGMNILSMGIWYECMQRWLGQANRVTAAGLTAVPQRFDGAGKTRAVTVPDHVDILAAYGDQIIAHLRFSAVAGLGRAPELWLFGRDGTLRFEAEGKRLYGAKRGAKSLEEIIISPEKRIGWRVEQEFINAIRGQEKVSRTSFEQGVLYMEFTEAVAQSMAEGRAITLPPVS